MKYNPKPEPGGWHKMEVKETNTAWELKNFGPHNYNITIMKNPEIDPSSKYYTPSIEDIKVGYEYESKDKDIWKNNSIQTIGQYTKAINLLDNPKMDGYHIRTPYLTKEQIEAEGYKLTTQGSTTEYSRDGVSDKVYYFAKGDLVIFHIPEYHQVVIVNKGEKIFKGECPSINEFRYICKLLGI